jgi:hypothetical protein
VSSQKSLQEPAFLVLTALAGGPLHGYALVQRLVAAQWAAFVLVPALTFAAGLVWLRRHERYLALTDRVGS